MAVENAREFFESYLPKRLESNPDMADKVKATYKFALTGDNGGTWVVDLSSAPGSISEGDGEAACTITIADTDFVDIVGGKTDATMAFMGGKLKVEGDMSLAMKLTHILK
ncbi:MAG: SCP2 sterol-binding domain-containing protein [Myxococcota bacterium]